VVVARVVFGSHVPREGRERQPDRGDARHVAAIEAGEAFRGDTDHREPRPSDVQLGAEHVGAAAELRLPVAVAEHRDRHAGGQAVFVGAEESA